MRFEGKTVIVTGAASGFGAAIAAQFGAEGANVVVSDINLDGARKVADTILNDGGKAIAVACDVRSGPENKAMVDAAVEAFGQLDMTINNAGLGHMSMPMHELPEDGYDLVFDTNTKSIYWSVKYAVPEMIKAGGGVIINTASIGAKRPRPNVTAYNASKGAVVTMTRGLAVELAQYKIRVNALCPVVSETGFIKTTTGLDRISNEARQFMMNEVPLRRLTEPRDVANAALFLASDDAEFLTGVCLDIDGGKGI